jgi:hypothetical protein
MYTLDLMNIMIWRDKDWMVFSIMEIPEGLLKSGISFKVENSKSEMLEPTQELYFDTIRAAFKAERVK